tara:strand:+ start:645 stop:1253 length:609 start_codon:yes stop_codon:yes gene_type:complete
MITIIDYGMGNLGSIINMFKRIGVVSKITSDLKEIKHAKKILLPGVGSFDKAMRKINDSGIKEILDYKVLKEEIPILGICLGMQLLTKSSEEGVEKGLGYIDAFTKRFSFQDKKYKVPHMGWNLVEKSTPSELTSDFDEESKFYFVHSFYVKVNSEENSIFKTMYGFKFDSAIQYKNIFGAQFHPEKSHKFGMKLLKNFSKI